MLDQHLRYQIFADETQFTGDGAGRDHDGYYWIRGRVDDVVNVSGHRLSTAEIEAALLEHRRLHPLEKNCFALLTSHRPSSRSGCRRH